MHVDGVVKTVLSGIFLVRLFKPVVRRNEFQRGQSRQVKRYLFTSTVECWRELVGVSVIKQFLLDNMFIFNLRLVWGFSRHLSIQWLSLNDFISKKNTLINEQAEIGIKAVEHWGRG